MPQSMPILCNIGAMKIGNAPANADRRKVLAATALAAYRWNVSRYLESAGIQNDKKRAHCSPIR